MKGRGLAARRAGVFAAAAVAWVVVLELACYAYLRFMPQRYNPLAFGLASMIEAFHPLFRPNSDPEARGCYYPYANLYNEVDWGDSPPPYPHDPLGWVMPLMTSDGAGRPRYAVMDKAPGVLRVIVLGGSTLAGVGQSSPEARVSARLEARLSGLYPERKFEVINSAVIGHRAADELVLLATKVVAFRPDAVVVVDGYNEFFRAFFHPDLPPFWGQSHAILRQAARNAQTFRGSLAQFGLLLTKRFYCLAAARAAWLQAEGRRERSASVRPESFERGVREWTQAHRSIIGIARAHGIPLVAGLQPNVAFRKTLSAWESENRGWREGVAPGFSQAAGRFFLMARGAFAELAGGAYGPRVELADLTGIFEKDEETLYVDSCHYNDRAADLLAQALAPRVGRVLALGAPGKSRR